MIKQNALPRFSIFAFLALAALFLLPGSALADEVKDVNDFDTGTTAWMLVCSVLVLLMTLPGLALFYGGLVRTKNVLSILVQCFAIAAVMSLLWVAYGYTFATQGDGAFFGDSSKAFLKGITKTSDVGGWPESVFVFFQMTFAIITPALVVGAFAERMKFAAVMIFSIFWFTLSYLPIWHMAWYGAAEDGVSGLFWQWGVLDFAGGTVVHINAGIAGLVACIMVGKRKGFGSQPLTPHNVPMTVIGASLLWVGWFGFNAGSAAAANGDAGMAALVTQIATAAAVLTWLGLEWIFSKKPTAVGGATGAVAGLVAITPASGSCGPMGAIIIGVASALGGYYCAIKLKHKLGYDDSLDVFGVHGIGGIIGALLTGICCFDVLGGFGGEHETMGAQFWAQLKSVGVTIVWSGVVSIATLFAIKATIGLRVDESDEERGLDQTSHGETGYTN